MVRLGVSVSQGTNVTFSHFNSTMVRLGARGVFHTFINLLNFNSTMVRLGEGCISINGRKFVFQFHYGTIGGRAHQYF